VTRTGVSEQSPSETTAVLYVDDDRLLLDLQADIADRREEIELVTTPSIDRAVALQDGCDFDYVVVGSGRAGSMADRFTRDAPTASPDTTAVLYAWEPWATDVAEAFDAVLQKQVRPAETVQLLDRIRWLDN